MPSGSKPSCSSTVKSSGVQRNTAAAAGVPPARGVAGIIRRDRIIIPSGESVVEPDDRIIIFATRDAIPGVEKILAVKLDYI